jgi:hypothetical protein
VDAVESTVIFSIVFFVYKPNYKSSKYSNLVPREKPVTFDLYPNVDNRSVTLDWIDKSRLLSEFLKFGLDINKFPLTLDSDKLKLLSTKTPLPK